MPTTNLPALHVYGGAHPNAMRGLATGKRDGKPLERKQEILTPPLISTYVRELFGGDIELDPCPSFDHADTVQARHVAIDGLKEPWRDRTYGNPPYKFLKAWLAYAVAHAAAHPLHRIVVLCPVRTHRKWWREAAKQAGFVLYLDPIAFVGYTQVFPAPLCLMGFNMQKPEPTLLGDFL